MNEPVPYIAFESAQTRFERINRRLLTALIIAIVLIFVSNAAWLWAWMQYDYTSETTTTETVTVDGKDGIASYANNGGSVINGTGETNKDDGAPQGAQTIRFTGDTQEEVIP